MAQDNRLTGQLSLEGFDSPRKVEAFKKKALKEPLPKGTDRLFFAILPPAAVADEIAKRAQRLCEQHGLQSDPLLRKHFHITLSHLGDCVGVPEHIVNTVSQVAGSLVLPPFEVTLDRVISFSRGDAKKRPFVLKGGSGLAALLSFQKRLVQGVTDAEIWSQPGFTPHLTLAYDYKDVAEQPVEPIQWTVREFVLVHSLLGQTQHRHLGRWALNG